MKYHLFKSTKHENQAIKIGETNHGLYFIAAMENQPDCPLFSCIQEIEKALDDKLVMIVEENNG